MLEIIYIFIYIISIFIIGIPMALTSRKIILDWEHHIKNKKIISFIFFPYASINNDLSFYTSEYYSRSTQATESIIEYNDISFLFVLIFWPIKILFNILVIIFLFIMIFPIKYLINILLNIFKILKYNFNYIVDIGLIKRTINIYKNYLYKFK